MNPQIIAKNEKDRGEEGVGLDDCEGDSLLVVAILVSEESKVSEDESDCSELPISELVIVSELMVSELVDSLVLVLLLVLVLSEDDSELVVGSEVGNIEEVDVSPVVVSELLIVEVDVSEVVGSEVELVGTSEVVEVSELDEVSGVVVDTVPPPPITVGVAAKGTTRGSKTAKAAGLNMLSGARSYFPSSTGTNVEIKSSEVAKSSNSSK